MNRKTFFLVHAAARANAKRAIDDAPDGYAVEVKEPTRNLEQNARMWAMLGDIAHQVEWYGKHLSSEDFLNDAGLRP